MAKGYPDFFGYSIFPQFGAFQITNQPIVNIADSTTGEVFSVSAKGKIYSGFVEIYTTSKSTQLIQPKITLDGNATTYPPLRNMLRLGLSGSKDLPIVLTRYHKAIGYYAIVIHTDLTFGQSFVFEIVNNCGAQVDAWGDLYWAKVTG